MSEVYKERLSNVSPWRTIMLINEAQQLSNQLLFAQRKNSMSQPAHCQDHQRLFLSHPVLDSNIITWLNLKGKLSFDFTEEKKNIAVRLRDLVDAIPT